MKIIHVLSRLFLIVAFSLFMLACKTTHLTKAGKSKLSTQDSSRAAKGDSTDNLYRDLRGLAFSATPDQIGVPISSDQTKIYGVVMDWGFPEGTATLVTFLSGDASMYYSSGGAIIGGIGHENVKQAAVAFVNKAGSYMARAIKTDSIPLPGKDEVKFYFLTNKGKFVGQEQVRNFENNSSQWLDLFENGNIVITELRKTVDKR